MIFYTALQWVNQDIKQGLNHKRHPTRIWPRRTRYCVSVVSILVKIDCVITYCITVTSPWARWRLKSPASPLFAQLLVLEQIKKTQRSASQAFVRGIHRWPVTGDTKGQWRGKCFHKMTSSWYCIFQGLYVQLESVVLFVNHCWVSFKCSHAIPNSCTMVVSALVIRIDTLTDNQHCGEYWASNQCEFFLTHNTTILNKL